MNEFRTGYVGIIGRPNVGKSTLLNQLLDHKLSIVSRKPQTTRYNLLGIKTTSKSQIIYIDTPGLQRRPKHALNRYMNKEVVSSLNHADIILFIVEAMRWNDLDDNVLSVLKNVTDKKIFLIINKVDKISNKDELLPYINELNNKLDAAVILPISAIKEIGVMELEKLINKNLPIGTALYPEDYITDRNERFFAAEFLREQLMSRLGDEIPYRLTITIDEFKIVNNIYHIHACIWVEKTGQKAIVIGKNGAILKSAGKAAREELEILYDKKVNLKTWVKVKNKWTDSEQALKQFGYYET